jgi:hypothetical protein
MSGLTQVIEMFQTGSGGGGGGGGLGGSGFIQSGVVRNRIYFGGSPLSTVPASAVISINSIYAIPFSPGVNITVDAIDVEQTGMGGVLFATRIGIYKNISDVVAPSDLYPGALITDQILLANAVQVHSLAINVPLTAGKLYWFVMFTNDNVATYRGYPPQELFGILGQPNTTFAGGLGVGYKANLAFGALPANYPAGAPIMSTATDAFIPAVGVHRA